MQRLLRSSGTSGTTFLFSHMIFLILPASVVEPADASNVVHWISGSTLDTSYSSLVKIKAAMIRSAEIASTILHVSFTDALLGDVSSNGRVSLWTTGRLFALSTMIYENFRTSSFRCEGMISDRRSEVKHHDSKRPSCF